MLLRDPAGSVLDEYYTQTFAGHVRQLLIEDERDFCILADVFLSRDACREKCGHGNEQRNLIHGAFSFGWRRRGLLSSGPSHFRCGDAFAYLYRHLDVLREHARRRRALQSRAISASSL